MTRLELANQLIENQSAFHFAFIPILFGARGEIRTPTLLILSQLPLPVGPHALRCLVPAEGFEHTLSSF